MQSILDKLSTYNTFTNIFIGSLFLYTLSIITRLNYIQDNFIVSVSLYYFIGLVINRIACLFVEPVLDKALFLKFVTYADFIRFSKKDPKIELLSESNTLYKSIITTFPLVFGIKYYLIIMDKYKLPVGWEYIFFIPLLFAIFLFSYRKRSNDISKRIEVNKKRLRQSSTNTKNKKVIKEAQLVVSG